MHTHVDGALTVYGDAILYIYIVVHFLGVYTVEWGGGRYRKVCAAGNVHPRTYLTAFSFDRLQFSPLLDGLGKIDLAQWHLNLADLVVLREAVKVEDGKH